MWQQECLRNPILGTTFNSSDAVALRSASLHIIMKSNMRFMKEGNNTKLKNLILSLICLKANAATVPKWKLGKN